jgi:hypothetical protein
MFQLVAQWRVGRAYVAPFGLTLAIGQETIWDARRGWHETVATRMLLSRRTVGGTRRGFNRVRLDIKPILPRPVFTRRI